MKIQQFAILIVIIITSIVCPSYMMAQDQPVIAKQSDFKKMSEDQTQTFIINASSTDKEIDQIKATLKQQLDSEITISIKRNTDQQITSIIAMASGKKNNSNISISGDAPIKDIFIKTTDSGEVIFLSRTTINRDKFNKISFENRDSLRFQLAERKKRSIDSFKKKLYKKKGQAFSRLNAESNTIELKIAANQTDTQPLIIINGRESNRQELDLIEPHTIDHINVLKGTKAIDAYGEKGKNGAILITLKK